MKISESICGGITLKCNLSYKHYSTTEKFIRSTLES